MQSGDNVIREMSPKRCVTVKTATPSAAIKFDLCLFCVNYLRISYYICHSR